MMLGLGTAMGNIGLESEALPPLAEAADLARVTDDRDLLVDVALAYGAGAAVYVDPTGAGLAIVDEALASLPESESRLRLRLLIRPRRMAADERSGRVPAYRRGGTRPGRPYVGESDLRLASLTMYCTAVTGLPGHDELEPMADEMMSLLSGHTAWQEVIPPLYQKLNMLLRRGNLTGAEHHIRVAEQIAGQLRSRLHHVPEPHLPGVA